MEKKTYIIPRNYTSFFTVGEMINGRNLTEAIIITLLLCKGISYIPFVKMVKLGVMVVLGGICFLVFLIGYNDESIISFLQGYFTYKISSGIRRIKIPDKIKIKEKEEEKKAESYVEKFIRNIVHRKN